MPKKRNGIKRFIEVLNKRIKKGELTKKRALAILRGKQLAISKRKKRIKREEILLKNLKNRLLRRRKK